MSFEAGAVKSIEANHSYLRKGSDVFDRNKLGSGRKGLKWTGRKTEKGQKPYRLTTDFEWPPFINRIIKAFQS